MTDHTEKNKIFTYFNTNKYYRLQNRLQSQCNHANPYSDFPYSTGMALNDFSDFWFLRFRLIFGAPFARLLDSFDVIFINPRKKSKCLELRKSRKQNISLNGDCLKKRQFCTIIFDCFVFFENSKNWNFGIYLVPDIDRSIKETLIISGKSIQ